MVGQTHYLYAMSIDYALFEIINQDAANAFLDWLLPIYRDKKTWIPLYAIIAFLLFKNYGWKRTMYLLICIAAVITVADQLAAGVLKPWTGRLRPCAEPSVADTVRSLVGCGGKFSFPSNHATNHFALAGVLSLTFFRDITWVKWSLYAWAASICLAQVYVGKHWPGDVLAGAILGWLLAYGGVVLYRYFAKQNAIARFSPPAGSPPS